MTTGCEKLKKLMLKHQLNQIDLVNQTGISKATISKFMRGKVHNMQSHNLNKIAKFFNCKIEDLLSDEVPKHAPGKNKVCSS